jgi:hypothetical protein
MDNSRENIGLKNKLEKEGIEVQFELTSPNTPEQNGQVERCNLMGKGKSYARFLRYRWQLKIVFKG